MLGCLASSAPVLGLGGMSGRLCAGGTQDAVPLPPLPLPLVGIIKPAAPKSLVGPSQ